MPKSEFWDKLKVRLIEATNAAADFTEEQAKVGKLKFDILNLNRKIDHFKLEIGARALEISRSSERMNPLDDVDVKKKIASIGDLEAQIEFKKREITDTVDEIRGRRKPAAAPKKDTPPAASNPVKAPGKTAPKQPKAAKSKKAAAPSAKSKLDDI